MEEEKNEEVCARHGQNVATKICYGFEYVQRELERMANAFERIAKSMEDRNRD